MKRSKAAFAVIIASSLMLFPSCVSIRRNLPSAPSTEGVSEKNIVPSFDITKRMRSYGDMEQLLLFTESLFSESHEFSSDEIYAIDGRSAELLTELLSAPLFPYEGKDAPYREMISLFGEGALPRTEKALRRYTESYEKALWDELRMAESLSDLSSLREKYSFFTDDGFENVLVSLYLRKAGVADEAVMRRLVSSGELEMDLSGKTYRLGEDVDGRDEIKALLASSGYAEED